MGKGLWWDFFGLSEAVSEMGGAIVSSSYHCSGQWGRSLRRFPGSWQRMMSHNLVILANVDAPALRARGRVLIEEYVKNGGALFVLGGPSAFEQGGYAHTSLEDLLPCRMTGKKRLKADEGLVMRPADGADDILPADLAWQMMPRVYYYHAVEPKPGALVLVRAGDRPLLIVWEVGKGRVAVLAASAEGDPPVDELPFWEWGDMPRLSAFVCKWLMSAPRTEPLHVIDEASRQLLNQLIVPSPDAKDSQLQQLLTGLLARCRDRVFAMELLAAVSAFDGSPERRFVEAVARTVRPFVDADSAAEFMKEADCLIESGAAGKADLGIRLLGMCRPKGGGARIKKFFTEGVTPLSGGDGNDDLDLDNLLAMGTDPEIGTDERLKLAAVVALGELGDAASVDFLREVTIRFSGERQQLLYITELSNLKEEIYQQSLGSRCRLGDARAIGPFFSVVTKNENEIEEFRNVLSRMLVNKDDKVLMHKRKLAGTRLSVLYRRRDSCLAVLRRTPFSLAGDVVKELAGRNNRVLTPYAYAALTPSDERKLTPEVAGEVLLLLEECKIPELRLLAFRLAAGLDDHDISGRLTGIIVRLASSPDAASARFALRRVPQLPPTHRLAVISAGLKHSDQEIRRLAKLSLPLLTEQQRNGILSVGLTPIAPLSASSSKLPSLPVQPKAK